MQVHLLGIRHQSGKAKATGNDYSIPTLIIRSPIEEVSNSTLTIRGKGFEAITMPFAEDDYHHFTNLPYPCDVELETRAGQRQGELVTVAVRAKLLPAQKIQAVS